MLRKRVSDNVLLGRTCFFCGSHGLQAPQPGCATTDHRPPGDDARFECAKGLNLYFSAWPSARIACWGDPQTPSWEV